MGLSRQASDCDSTIQLVRGPYPEEEKRAWSCHGFPATVSKHGIKGCLPLHPGQRPSRWREPTEIRSTGTVTAPAPSDRRMSLPSPRLSRCCTTPRAVQLGRGAVCCCIVPKALRVAGAYEDQSTGTGGPSFALWRAYFPTVSQAVPKRRHAQSRPAGLWGFRAVFTPSRKFSALRVQVAHSQ